MPHRSFAARLRRASLLVVPALAIAGLVLQAQGPAGPASTGASATWHWLQKLGTTASALHTTAHPDDEHGGMLALLSRGVGARVSAGRRWYCSTVRPTWLHRRRWSSDA